MPGIVARGRRPAVIACGFCHLPDGAGRPENAMLAGLSADYITEQVAAIRSRTRRSAAPGPFPPSDLMQVTADSATDQEIAEAADYFSRLKPRARARIIESLQVPRTEAAVGLYVRSTAGGDEPLGGRIIEVPVDAARHDLRDSQVRYLAYVPPGSVERGRRIATMGTDGGQACAACHGADLRGTALAPPIAGRSPSYLLRQLIGFKIGTRATAAAASMQAIAGWLGLDEMVAVAAYAGSRAP